MKISLFISLSFVLFALGTFGQDEVLENSPCQGTTGLVVNFDKISNEIVETECDSLQILADFITSETGQDFAVIGVFTSRDDKKDKKKAQKRAKLVRKELIKLGIDKNRLKVYLGYHKPPGENDHHDWPFYPEGFTYEIGVYLQGDI